MKRFLLILMLPLMSAAVAEEPTASFDITCGADVIGTATLTDGVLDVSLVAEPVCDGELTTEIDGSTVTVYVSENEDGYTVTLDTYFDEGVETVEDPHEVDEKSEAEGDVEDEIEGEVVDEVGGEVEEILHGLDRADAAAGEHGAHGRAVARAAQERIGGIGGKPDFAGKVGARGKASGDDHADDGSEKEADVEGDVEHEVEGEVEAEVDVEVDVEVEGVGAIGLD